MNKQAGYTLVELVTVLTVVGILSVMAAGSFSSFNAKTQAMEGLKITEAIRGEYSTYYTETGKTTPATLGDLYGTGDGSQDVHHVGAYVERVGIDGGDIVVTYGLKADPALSGSRLVLRPYESVGGAIIWRCGFASVPTGSDGITPLNRAGTQAGAALAGTALTTTVAEQYLPRSCRT